jgi:hypothetical protein
MSFTTSVVAAAGSVGSTPQGPTIDVFYNFGGGHCRIHRQHPLGGLPSISPLTSIVVDAGPTGSTP